MGVLYARQSGAWVPVAGQGIGIPAGGTINQVLSKASATDFDTSWANLSWVVQTPFLIPDPTGAAYPALRFQSGDGGNGVGPNPYHYEFNLYNDVLHLFSNRQSSRAIVQFARPATDVSEFILGANWAITDQNDGYMRWHYGADRVTSEAFLSSSGDFTVRGSISVPGSVTVTGWMTSANVTCSAGNIYGYANGYINVHSNNPSDTSLQVGASNGSLQNIVYMATHPTANGWNNSSLCVAKHAGAGECAIGFVNHTNGWTARWQMYAAPGLYLGATNGANTALIELKAAAFTVVSSRRFKADIERLGSRASALVDRVEAVRYRDLAHEMALEPSEPAHNVRREPQPPIEPRFRFGLVAEEIEDVASELISADTMFGAGLDLSGLIAVLWQAVKDLRAEVAALQSATP